MLTVLETLPANFLDTPARELHRILPGPTLIHLPGRRAQPLFVSVLLHGNEDSGVVALQSLLRAHAQRPLPRALSILVGNVAAARMGLRRLDTQPDYNRTWPGTDQHGSSPEHAAMREVWRIMLARKVFASIDVHNNSGINPYYSVVNRLEHSVLHLALLFSRTVVWFRGLPGSQTSAFAAHCPALTVECGKPGAPASEEHAARFLDACLHLAQFPSHAVPEHDIDLYHTVATVRVPAGVSFAFGDPAAEVSLHPQLDHMNFRPLTAGKAFGRSRLQQPLDVRDESGRDVSDAFFSTRDGRIRLLRAATPAMLTLDARAIRQDCLCYLMERLALPHHSAAAAGALCASA
ncbi:MAG TPA: M14 family metallopeptidase [Accumulibacter sp.]|uniref:M14 family metallopeptidase n=1 Tax=Accumulibacter sp. TaxID=2053492 RepID=UPI0028783A9B|nr:M14 family metallopeptidase [Accumulibacter sp.]MDS4053488.1 M14 family metallopeptidase [Accumulibacter sp.]HMV04437.1 M14 family metallopeptidase [Accumulibacter sp.]HMW62724.1 M14 family metallopeptidase [Accumulibacter sp.]HMW79066.1 M14 family metallopeptidase [Accumulibacter sp.]HMX68552.1 M14 family metallopeptidase [Accumulibacter sp.]